MTEDQSNQSESAPYNKGTEPTKAKRNSRGDIANGKFQARLEPEVVKYLKLLAETEDISLNDAINLAISRNHHYPKDLAEIYLHIEYCRGQLDLIQAQLELCQLHEAQLIHLLETGQVEARLEEALDREEAAIRAAHPGA